MSNRGLEPSMSSFGSVLDSLSSTSSGFVAVLPADWAQGRAVFGGLLGALAVRALAGTIGEARPVRSVLASFAGPVAPGEVELRVEPLREGRALTQAEVRVVQAGEVRAVLLAACGAARPTSIPSSAEAAPALPEGLVTLPHLEGVIPAFAKHFRYQWRPEGIPFTGAANAALGGLVRFAEATPLDAAAILALLDAWPAPVLPRAPRPAPASTATWMVSLVRPLPMASDHGWCRFEGSAVASGEGYADVVGRLWAPDGGLIATSRQLVAEFSATATS